MPPSDERLLELQHWFFSNIPRKNQESFTWISCQLEHVHFICNTALSTCTLIQWVHLLPARWTHQSSSAPQGRFSCASSLLLARLFHSSPSMGSITNSATWGSSQPAVTFPQTTEALLILRQDLGKCPTWFQHKAARPGQLTFKTIAPCILKQLFMQECTCKLLDAEQTKRSDAY